MARPPPGQPAGTRAAGRNHAAARQLHRKRALRPGPRHGGAPGRVARGSAPGAQRPAAGGGVRARLSGDPHRRPPARAGPRGPGAHPRGAPALLTPPVNVPRVLLHPQGMAPRIVNLDEWAWHVLDRLRQEVLNIPNGRLDALVNELEALVPDRPRQPGPDYLGFAVPLRLRSGDGELRLLTTLAHFGT